MSEEVSDVDGTIKQICNAIESAAGISSIPAEKTSEVTRHITILISDDGRIKFDISGVDQEAVPIWLKRAAISAENMLLGRD